MLNFILPWYNKPMTLPNLLSFYSYNHPPIVTIFGGTGFLGRQIIQKLVQQGCVVKVASRNAVKVNALKPYGYPGQIIAQDYNPLHQSSITQAINGSDIVINCVGLLYESGRRNRFDKMHVQLPQYIAMACHDLGIANFVHISALGVDRARSVYAKTKLAGEQIVHRFFPDAVILRPSIIYGPGDNFFNMFADMAGILPALPLIGGGKTKFQPIFVGDVAQGVMNALVQLHQHRNHDAHFSPAGRIYELGGPEILTFRQLYLRLFNALGWRRPLIWVPWPIAFIQGAILGLLPHPLLTFDQVKSLRSDNIVQDGAYNLEKLQVAPHGMELILQSYIGNV